MLENGLQALQLLIDFAGVVEPVFSQQRQLVLQGRATHRQQQVFALVQHLVELVLVLRQLPLQTL